MSYSDAIPEIRALERRVSELNKGLIAERTRRLKAEQDIQYIKACVKEINEFPLTRVNGRSQGWRLTPSEVAQALRSAAASGSYIAEPNLRPANSRKGNSFLERIWDM